MSNEQIGSKKPTVVSLISGKGGVGKTALAASFGKLLTTMGYKVLLVDSDLITHGLTFLVGFDSEKTGLLEEYNKFRLILDHSTNEIGNAFKEFWQKFDEKKLCKVNENLRLLQSAALPSRKYSDLIIEEGPLLSIFLSLFIKALIDSGNYHFVIIDTQAGAVDSTKRAIENSDKVVTVMEPDPVATYATENVVGEFRDLFPIDSFYIINKLSVEEASGYEAITQFLKIIRHLPPIPFDFEVRRAFMIRQIPVNEKKPSPFMLSIIRMMKDLLPNISDNLDKFQNKIEKQATLPLKMRIEKISDELDETISLEFNMKNRLEMLNRRKIRFNFILRQSIAVITIFTLVFMFSYYYEIIFESAWLPSIAIALSIITVIITLSSFSTKFFARRSSDIHELKKSLILLKETQNWLRKEYESFQNLLISRSKDFMIINEDYINDER